MLHVCVHVFESYELSSSQDVSSISLKTDHLFSVVPLSSWDHILIPENKTWLEAQLYCKKNQSNLVSIRNEMENEQVKEAVNGRDSVWIGLQYNYKVAWSDGGHSGYKQDPKAVCFTFLPNRTCNTSNLIFRALPP
uniref:C-type lectin domain-containing protein n=1 Tax=Sinocyclocheilus grahami TaxID=75366 RepID=A0A672R8X9_SINGR